jgi:hypothetical protein
MQINALHINRIIFMSQERNTAANLVRVTASTGHICLSAPTYIIYWSMNISVDR